MLAGVGIVCFTTSYLISLVLEVSRLFFRAPIRIFVIIGFALIGIAMQMIYLTHQALAAEDPLPLSSWYHWCLIASLVLAIIYVYWAISRPSSSIGIFLLPIVLAMVGLAYVFQNAAPFPSRDAIFRIGMIHGVSLLIGTIAALLGLSAGLMYLVQDYRLKHKLPPKQGLKLPSLEWLQIANERSLLTSGLFLLLGLGSGAMLNLYRTIDRPDAALSWTDPVVWFSAILFIWLVVALGFNLFYKPAREGHKVVYLTLASCGLLALVMTVVLFSSSAHPPEARLPGSQRNAFDTDSAAKRLRHVARGASPGIQGNDLQQRRVAATEVRRSRHLSPLRGLSGVMPNPILGLAPQANLCRRDAANPLRIAEHVHSSPSDHGVFADCPGGCA